MAIARVGLRVASHAKLDYWVPPGLDAKPGVMVRVHLGARALVGVVIDVQTTSAVPHDKLQPIDEIVSAWPLLADDLLALAAFASQYYQEPLGQVLALMTPPLGRGAVRTNALKPHAAHEGEPVPPLSA